MFPDKQSQEAAANQAVEEEVRVQEATEDDDVEAPQDNKREKQLRELYGLVKPEGSGRSGTDAELLFKEKHIPFELKSTTTDGVTTARDVGIEHIEKWRGKHWLIGFYNGSGKTLSKVLYASPDQMEPWIWKSLT